MAIIIKTPEEIEKIREGGKRLAAVLLTVAAAVRPGISALDLDAIAREEIQKMGDIPAFLNYRPLGHRTSFPAAICISVNSEVVHGIPKATTILKEGDIVSLDLGVNHKGCFTDHAITVPVGAISKEKEKLLRVTREAMYQGIEAIVPGARIGDIGYAVESYANSQGTYGTIRDLAGHGVGRAIHEDPFIPNYGKKGTGAKLVPGMIIAIEPMLTLGTEDLIEARDEWTLKTADNSAAAHFEHTVLVTETGYEILTQV